MQGKNKKFCTPTNPILENLPNQNQNKMQQEAIELLRRIDKNIEALVGNQPEHLTVKEAANLLRVSQGTINNMVNAGAFKRYKLGGSTFFKRSELLAAITPGK